MKKSFALIALLGASLAATPMAFAQQASAPAGSTGQCKDGSYTSQATKRGACRGHKGVQEWYAAATGASVAAAAPTPATPTGATPPPAAKTAATTPSAPAAAPVAAPAAGGGPGQVWVNTGSKSKAYHCQGDKWYGKTKQGQYMTKDQAEAQGYHAAKGDKCS